MVRRTDAGLRTPSKNITPQILINLFAKRFRLLDTLTKYQPRGERLQRKKIARVVSCRS
ncbi:MAG: hypothetical protein R3Y09_00730 [Clostridia bacterium]